MFIHVVITESAVTMVTVPVLQYSTHAPCTNPLLSATRFLIYMMMHVKDTQLFTTRVGHFVMVTGLCVSLYSLHVLNRDVSLNSVLLY